MADLETLNGSAPSAGGPPPKWSWGKRPPQVYCLAGAVAVMPFVALFASTQTAALLLLLGALVLVTNPVSGLGPFKTQPYLIPLAVLLAVGAVSMMWAAEGAEAAKRFWRLAGFTAFGILIVTHARELRDSDRRLLGTVLIAAVWVFLVLFAIERLSGKVLTQNLAGTWSEVELRAILNRPGTVLLLLGWPAAGFLFARGRPVHAVMLLMGCGLVQVGSEGQTAMVAWLAGGTAALLGAVAGRIWAAVFGAVLCLGVFGAPILVSADAVQSKVAGMTTGDFISARHRLLIWDFTAGRIGEKPVFGWGLGGSRAIPGADRNAAAYAAKQGIGWVQPGDAGRLGASTILPLHPHNAFLQVWLDLGLAGAAAAAAFLWLCARRCAAGPAAVRACRFGLLATAVTIACLSYGIWQSWWVATLFIVSALSAAIPDKVRRS